MKRNLFVLLLIFFTSSQILAWEGDTHRGITSQVEEKYEILNDYLINLGFSDGSKKTPFRLEPSVYPSPARLITVYTQEKSALNWLMDGAVREDVPTMRASNHFHDPTTLNGLNNLDDPDLPFFLAGGPHGFSLKNCVGDEVTGSMGLKR